MTNNKFIIYFETKRFCLLKSHRCRYSWTRIERFSKKLSNFYRARSKIKVYRISRFSRSSLDSNTECAARKRVICVIDRCLRFAFSDLAKQLFTKPPCHDLFAERSSFIRILSNRLAIFVVPTGIAQTSQGIDLAKRICTRFRVSCVKKEKEKKNPNIFFYLIYKLSQSFSDKSQTRKVL